MTAKGDIVKLIGCPFCGEAPSADMYQTESLWSHDTVWSLQIGCSNHINHIAFDHEEHEEVIEWWNGRYYPAEHTYFEVVVR